MPNRFTPLNPSTSQAAAFAQINKNFAELDREAVTKKFKDGDGNDLLIGKTGDQTFGMKMSTEDSTIEVGKLSSGEYGFSFSDGTVTFLKMTKDGLVLNDGTNDRILIGKSTGGF